ncbi:uncharacterized protein LOC124932990, partial [Impatiens glandulifera]|uniref:uncharacterized protein LOC124932990 n=1 Tax=Impatiens glandulifera TaxID=253017 RepID=UPI001FB09F7E
KYNINRLGKDGIGGEDYWRCWAVASISQLAWGIRSCRRGFPGDPRFMPLKAFAVGSLFVGSAASAFTAVLSASGIRSVNDAKEVGANIRSGLGITRRVQDK